MLSHRVLLLFTVSFVLTGSILGPAASLAQIPELAITYDEGLVRFDYDQYPWGGIEGTYTADGPIWNDDFTFPNEGTHGAGGIMEIDAVNDTNNVIAMSAIINPDGTVDAAIVFVAFPGVPAPGTFSVELGAMEAGFVWLDDTSNISFPEDNDFEGWFNSIEAAGKYVGMSGSIVVTEVDTDKFVGTFSGRMVNPGNFVLIDIMGGVFDLTNVYVTSAGHMPMVATMSAYPNPFNPQTVISLDMPQSGPALVQVFDLKGHCVKELAAGSFSEGNHAWVWDGTDGLGQRQAGGVYVAKAVGQGWSVNRKLVYIP